MFSHLLRHVILAARWVLLSCGCQVTVHGGRAPSWCPDCNKAVSSSDDK